MKVYALIGIFLCFLPAWAQRQPEQDIRVEAGKKNLTLDQPFILSVVVKNDVKRPLVTFPDFEGLEKRSASATSTTHSAGGKTIIIQTISQQYFASREGEYRLPAFTIAVDGNKVKAEGVELLFRKGDPAPDSTENESVGSEIVDQVEGPENEDVFLLVKASKTNVYVREGFALRLALYVARNAPIDMEFYQLNTQLQSILKKLRPATCWEENVGIEEIIQREVAIGGRRYTEYQMYQAVLFPFTLQSVSFPSVALNMLITETPPQGEKQKNLRAFSSEPLRVVVKPLPPHPLKDQISVGEYHLREKLTRDKLSSGESLRYLFTVAGSGNLAAITAPEIPPTKVFDFYPPDMKQTVQRSYEKVSGEKTFDYFIVAKQNGVFPLGPFFQWIYFDPVRARYDTLHSAKIIRVAGENLQTASLSDAEAKSIYENIEQLDTTIGYVDYQSIIRTLTNIVVVGLLGIMVWIIRK